jgi:hypothetical protein
MAIALSWLFLLFFISPVLLIFFVIPFGERLEGRIGSKAAALVVVYLVLVYSAIMLVPLICTQL